MNRPSRGRLSSAALGSKNGEEHRQASWRRKSKRRKQGRSERHVLQTKRPSHESPPPSVISIQGFERSCFRRPGDTRTRKIITKEARGEGGVEKIAADKEALESECCLPRLGQRDAKSPSQLRAGVGRMCHTCATSRSTFYLGKTTCATFLTRRV